MSIDPCDLVAHIDRERVYRVGYADGWTAAEDVTVGRVLLALENGPPDLTPLAPSYVEFRAVREAGPCSEPRCGACSVRREAIARNRARYGSDDYPGQAAPGRPA